MERKEGIMKRAVRFPIAGLMGAVLAIALGLAALRNATETWAGATFLVTCAVLCLAIVGVVCRRDAERAWWLGFALFGWGYLCLAFRSEIALPTMTLLDAVATRLGLEIQFPSGMGGGMRSIGLFGFGGFGGGFGGFAGLPAPQIAHCIWALLAALLGGTLARLLFGGPGDRSEQPESHGQTGGHPPRRWPGRPVVLGLACGFLTVLLGVIGLRTAPGLVAGAAFLLTWALLGVTVLGVASGQEQRRQVWLGAALFGVGYMTLAFGRSAEGQAWPSSPADHLLLEIRRWLPTGIRGFATPSEGLVAANARIWDALQRPAPMRFPNDTPLDEVLKYVRGATVTRTYPGIPIYIDPIGLHEAEKTEQSTVKIDLDGVPLATTLHLILKQLGLSYSVRDGLVLITSTESAFTPIYEDPYLVAGHCLLALLAAAIGAMLAPLVPGKHRGSSA
jgi:hypothetical protein